MAEHEVTTSSGKRAHTAGIYDIRNIIGSLLTIYGVILTAMGLFGDPETDKTGGSQREPVGRSGAPRRRPRLHRLGAAAPGGGARGLRGRRGRPAPGH